MGAIGLLGLDAPLLRRSRESRRVCLGGLRRRKPKTAITIRLIMHRLTSLQQSQIGHDCALLWILDRAFRKRDHAINNVFAGEHGVETHERSVGGKHRESITGELASKLDVVRLHLDGNGYTPDAHIVSAELLLRLFEKLARSVEVFRVCQLLDRLCGIDEGVRCACDRGIVGLRSIRDLEEFLRLGVFGECIDHTAKRADRIIGASGRELEPSAQLQKRDVSRRKNESSVDEFERATDFLHTHAGERAQDVELQIDLAALLKDLVELDDRAHRVALEQRNLAVGAQERGCIGRAFDQLGDGVAQDDRLFQACLFLVGTGTLRLVER